MVGEITGTPLAEPDFKERFLENFDSFYLREDYHETLIASFREWHPSKNLQEAYIEEVKKTYFDERNKWYPKAGITPVFLQDVQKQTEGLVKASGPELHPAIWSLFLKNAGYLENFSYTPNPCGGIDDHLDILGKRWGKTIYALETKKVRAYADLMKLTQELRGGSGEEIYINFFLPFDRVKNTFRRIEKKEEGEITKLPKSHPTLSGVADFFFKNGKPISIEERHSEPLQEDLVRNQEWVESILAHIHPKRLPRDKHILMYVGQSHVVDLIRRMKQKRMLSRVALLGESELYRRFG